MAAIQGTRISSSVVGMFVVAVAVALLVGAAGGYLVRGLSSQVSAPASAVENPPVTALMPPEWVHGYHDLLESVGFEGGATVVARR